MKNFIKWRKRWMVPFFIMIGSLIYLAYSKNWTAFAITFLATAGFSFVFYNFWFEVKHSGIQTEFDISRILRKDAKDELNLGGVGILTYDENYMVTWTSPLFTEKGINLLNQKLTSWIEDIRSLLDGEVDVIVGEYKGCFDEITKKEDAS